MTEQVYTPEQVATALQVKTTTVHKWLKQNKLRGFKLPGGDWRVSAQALHELIASPAEPMQVKFESSTDDLRHDPTLVQVADTYLELTRNPNDRMTAGEIIDHLRNRNAPLMFSDHQIAIYLNRLMSARGVERLRDASGRYYLGIRPKN